MSILINGMEMPTGSHEIIIRIQSDGCVLDQYGHRLNREHIAIPVPPHGRLADLDKIENEIAQLAPEDYTTGGIRLILDYAPTVIPAEEEE